LKKALLASSIRAIVTTPFCSKLYHKANALERSLVRHVDFGLVRISQPDTISGIPSISGKGCEECTISVEFSKSGLNEDVHNWLI